MLICRKYFTSVIGLFVFLFSCTSRAQQTDLTVSAFENGITQNNIQLLDVRTAAEYQSGHLKNALLAISSWF